MDALEAAIVYINENQLEQVEYLLYQSSLGNHLLFDSDTIKRVAPNDAVSTATDEARAAVENAERLLEEMILCPSLHQKRMFLAKLDRKTYDDVAGVYLRIVQNMAQDEQHEFPH